MFGAFLILKKFYFKKKKLSQPLSAPSLFVPIEYVNLFFFFKEKSRIWFNFKKNKKLNNFLKQLGTLVSNK